METNEELKQQSLQETLKRAEAFEAMIRTEGWGFINAYYQNAVQSLASNLLLKDKQSIGDFEGERRELIGLHKLISFIDDDIESAKQIRKEQNEQATASAGE